ncbi:hypothetical protein OAD62_01490 [Oceanihabitans sp.]|nr:hypothetical protein [Oceanihabitans sp.]
MKTFSTKIFLLLLIFNLISCKKENSTSSISEYKYAEQPQTINCANADSKLLNEALYTFENDITSFYDAKQKNAIRAYNGFIRQAASNKKPAFEEFASEHSVNIAKVLKETGVFNNDGLNYNHEIIKCIGENMSAAGLETTFNALISTNSMSKELYKPALSGKASSMDKDKYLGLYVALEYFYAEVSKIDFSQIDFEKRDTELSQKAKTVNPVSKIQSKSATNPNVDFNKRPRK